MTSITDFACRGEHNRIVISLQTLFSPQSKPSTLSDPLAHLLACHRRIEERLATLERAAEHLNDRTGAALVAFRSVFEFMDSAGVLHTADEEESLFPRLMPALERGERTYLAGLEHDHTAAHLIYTELKAKLELVQTCPSARAGVQGLVERLTELYRRHIASEDEVLQAYARRSLSSAQLDEIAAEMRLRRATPPASASGQGGPENAR